MLRIIATVENVEMPHNKDTLLPSNQKEWFKWQMPRSQLFWLSTRWQCLTLTFDISGMWIPLWNPREFDCRDCYHVVALQVWNLTSLEREGNMAIYNAGIFVLDIFNIFNIVGLCLDLISMQTKIIFGGIFITESINRHRAQSHCFLAVS